MNPTSETLQAVPPREQSTPTNSGQVDIPVSNVASQGPSLMDKLGGLFGSVMKKNPNIEQGPALDVNPVAPSADASSGLPPSDINAFTNRLNDNQAPSLGGEGSELPSPSMGEPQVVTMGSSPEVSPVDANSSVDSQLAGLSSEAAPAPLVDNGSVVQEEPHIENVALDPTGVGVSGGESVIEQKTEPLSPDFSLDSSDAVHIPGVETTGGLGQDNTAAIEPQTSLENPSAVDTSPAVNSNDAQTVESNPEVVGSLDNKSKEEIREKVQAALDALEAVKGMLEPADNTQVGNIVDQGAAVGTTSQ